MPVGVSGLALSLLEDGALGTSSRDGKEKGEILDGQKLLASSFLSALSSQSAHLENVSKYLGIIEGWSKAGGKEEVKTRKQITSSGKFMTSQLLTSARLSQVMSPEKKIWLMDHQEAYTPNIPATTSHQNP